MGVVSSLTGRTPVAPPPSVEVLVVGAGPTGSAAAIWAARAGLDVLLLDAAVFPRDKTCGDGLTPRAMAEMDRLGLGGWARGHATNTGLRLMGFGREQVIDWPDRAFPTTGSAVRRTVLDDRIRREAITAGATMIDGARVTGIEYDGARVAAAEVTIDGAVHRVACRVLIVADGVRSPVGRMLGRTWHRDTPYGVAARAYIASDRHDDPRISSHLELRDAAGTLLSGYGWIFPLGDGTVNIGAGSLQTAARPARAPMRPLLAHYVDRRREDWELTGEAESFASALLPMGGAVEGVAGANWALVGDAAACVNPLNGEGIDYGLEGARLLVDLLTARGLGADLTRAWPLLLSTHYGPSFALARRLAGLLTLPRFLPAAGPVGMSSQALMTAAVRVMGNLVTEQDTDLVGRTWRAVGRGAERIDRRPLFGASG